MTIDLNEHEKKVAHQLDEFTIRRLKLGHRLVPELLSYLQDNPDKTSDDWLLSPTRTVRTYEDPNAPLLVQSGWCYTNIKTGNIYEIANYQTTITQGLTPCSVYQMH